MRRRQEQILQRLVSDNELLIRFDTRSNIWIIRNPVDGHYLGTGPCLSKAAESVFRALETYEDVRT